MGKKITISVRSLVAYTLLIAIVISAFYFAPVSEAGVETFNITNQERTITAGQSFQIKLNGIKASKVKWKSNNTSVATVSKKGIVKGVKKGKTVIKGTYNGLVFNVTVIVNPAYKKQTVYNDKNVRVSYLKTENQKVYFSIENKTDDVIGASLESIEYDGNYVGFSKWLDNNFSRINANSSAVCYFEYKSEKIKSVYMELYYFSTKLDDNSLNERKVIRLNFE